MVLASVADRHRVGAAQLAAALGVGRRRAYQLLAGEPLPLALRPLLEALIGLQDAAEVYDAQPMRVGSGRVASPLGELRIVESARRIAIRHQDEEAARALSQLAVAVRLTQPSQ